MKFTDRLTAAVMSSVIIVVQAPPAKALEESAINKIANSTGTPIYASAKGIVERAGWDGDGTGYGNVVDIRHPDGSLTRYAQNSRILVAIGQKVKQGQIIAAMGSTGFSTGPHLHFEIHIPNRGAVNPIAYLPARRE